MRYLTQMRMSHIKNSRNNLCYQVCGGKGTLLVEMVSGLTSVNLGTYLLRFGVLPESI